MNNLNKQSEEGNRNNLQNGDVAHSSGSGGAAGQEKSGAEDLGAFDAWLNTPADYGVPNFLKVKPRKHFGYVPGAGVGAGVGIGRGRGRGRGRVRSPSPPHPENLDDDDEDGAPRRLFSNPAVPAAKKNLVKEPRFQQSMVKQQLDSSWDKAITTRVKKVSLTDPDFASAVKTAGAASEDCQHLIIHTTCKCSENRVIGVCTRCYLVFCNEPCLKEGLATPNSRVGLASQELLKDDFGVVTVPTAATTSTANSSLIGRNSSASSKQPHKPEPKKGICNTTKEEASSIGLSKMLQSTESSSEEEDQTTFHPPNPDFLRLPINAEAEIPLGVQTVVLLRCIESQDTFYFQWAQVQNFFEVELNSPSFPEEKLRPDEIQLGTTYCLVDFEGDFLNPCGFQRSRILSFDETRNTYKVKLVDIGLCVDRNLDQIRKLPQRFLNFGRKVVKVKTTTHFGIKETFGDFVTKLFQAIGDPDDEGFHHSAYMVLITHVGCEKLYDPDKYAKYWGQVTIKGLSNLSDWAIRLGLARERYHDDTDLNCTVLFNSAMNNEPASKDPFFVVGDRIPVQICPGAVSYNDFFAIPDAQEHELRNISLLLERLDSFGMTRYKPNEHVDRSNWGPLCCVKDPETRQLYRGRIRFIEKDGEALVSLIDTGETYNFDLNSLLQMPKEMRQTPPLAYQCSLPICLYPMPPKEQRVETMVEAMERFEHLNDETLHKQGLVARVFLLHNGFNVVDLHFVSEKVTFCEALISINQARLRCSEELKVRVEKEFYQKKDSPILSVDAIAAEPVRWNNRAKKSGFYPEAPEKLVSLLMVTSKVNKPGGEMRNIEFHHSLLEKLPHVATLKDKICLFNHFLGFNVFTLMDKESGEKNLAQLENTISAYVATTPAALTADSNLVEGQVVLVPYRNGETFRRSVVEKVNTTTQTVTLRLLEYGTQLETTIAGLQMPNQEIMKIPLFVHFVRLFNVADDVPILIQHFRELRSSLNGSAILCDDLGEEQVSKMPMVSLKTESTGENLSTLINQLAIWRWRRLYRAMYTSFNEIVKVDGFSTLLTPEEYFMKSTIPATTKKNVFDVRVQYTSTAGSFALVFCLPMDPILMYQSRTVHSQLQLYLARVDPPTLSEDAIRVTGPPHMVSAKPEKNSDTKERISLCTWHRAFYNVSYGELICCDCFWRTSEFEKVEVCPLTPDFYEACPSGLIVKIDLTQLTLEGRQGKAITKKLFPKGITRQIKILSRHPKLENNLPIYDAKLLEYI